MGMEDELLGPGVKDGEDADGAADKTPVAGELDDRLGGGFHERGVTCAATIKMREERQSG